MSSNAVVETYLFFGGNCEEAVNFYQSALGAEIGMISRYKEAPKGPHPTPPGFENKIMHVRFKVGGTQIMASDNPKEKPHFDGFSLSLNLKSEDDARRYFAALSAGGKVEMPLEKTFFSPLFGMLEDKFGIGWMIHVQS